jgi:hypothetical protein
MSTQFFQRAMARAAVGICAIFLAATLVVYVRMIRSEDIIKWNMMGRNCFVFLSSQKIYYGCIAVTPRLATPTRWEARETLPVDSLDFSDFLTVPGPHGPSPIWPDISQRSTGLPNEIPIQVMLAIFATPIILYACFIVAFKVRRNMHGFEVRHRPQGTE